MEKHLSYTRSTGFVIVPLAIFITASSQTFRVRDVN